MADVVGRNRKELTSKRKHDIIAVIKRKQKTMAEYAEDLDPSQKSFTSPLGSEVIDRPEVPTGTTEVASAIDGIVALLEASPGSGPRVVANEETGTKTILLRRDERPGPGVIGLGVNSASLIRDVDGQGWSYSRSGEVSNSYEGRSRETVVYKDGVVAVDIYKQGSGNNPDTTMALSSSNPEDRPAIEAALAKLGGTLSEYSKDTQTGAMDGKFKKTGSYFGRNVL